MGFYSISRTLTWRRYMTTTYDVIAEEYFEDLEAEYDIAERSSDWAVIRAKKTDSEGVVLDLIRIREAVRNLIKVHGHSYSDLSLEFALPSDIGENYGGFASFRTIPDFGEGYFGRPFIVLARSVYDLCDDANVLDVYCGLGLHEISHILHSRDIFRRLKNGTLKGLRASWEGLLEDERIERLCREESPGFSSYITAAKKVLFEDHFSDTLEWEALPDLDKVCFLIFNFIRCPYLLNEDMRSWKTIYENHVFEDIRRIIHKVPETEDDVELIGKRLNSYFLSIRRKYMKDLDGDISPEVMDKFLKRDEASEAGESSGDGESGEGESGEDESGEGESGEGESGEGESGEGESGEGESGEGESGEGESGEGESGEGSYKDKLSSKDRMRLRQKVVKNKRAIAHDREVDLLRKQAKSNLKHTRLKSDVDAVSEDVVGTKGEKTKEDEKTVKSLLEELERSLDERRGKRFNSAEIEEILSLGKSRSSSALRSGEATKLVEYDKDKIKFADDWKFGTSIAGLGTSRRCVIVHPNSETGKAAYSVRKPAVSSLVARMRNVFRLRLGTRHFRETELKEGKLHRRMLAKVPITDRVFTRSYSRQDNGISLCLLLDESGSMGGVHHIGSRAGTTLQVATLIAEAVKGISGIELEVYSYTSCGPSNYDCLIKYLYGKQNKDIRNIGSYSPGQENYDHIALKVAGDLFIENTNNSNRVMIVVSDGSPCGRDYGGREANQATKNSVLGLDKKGISVINVAIESFASEEMFKHVIKFLDLATLVNDMRKLVTRIIKQATER